MKILPLLHRSNERRNASWDPERKLDLQFFSVELLGEIGEAANCIKKLERARLGISGSRSSIEALSEELADIVICASLVAMSAGVEIPISPDPDVFRESGDPGNNLLRGAMFFGFLSAIVSRNKVFSERERFHLADHLWGVCYYAFRTAHCYDINLQEAIIRKFNSTSAKLNLPTFIEE